MKALALRLVACVAAASASRARALTFAVNSTADIVDAAPGDGVCATVRGLCTLRAAVQEANALPGADAVALPPGKVTLFIAGRHEDAAATGDLDVTGDLTISGAGRDASLVASYRVDRVFHVRASAHLTLVDLSVLDGEVAPEDAGGGILNAGTLTLTRVAVRNNRAAPTDQGEGAGNGGGLDNAGTATLSDVIFDGNVAADGRNCGGGGWGGGIFNSGTLSMTNASLSGNRAGNGTPLSLATDCADGAGDGGDGAGLYNEGTATLSRVSFAANRAGNGSVGQFEGNDSGGGRGAGLYNAGMVSLTDVSFIGNIAGQGSQGTDEAGEGGDGGGMVNDGNAILLNVTFDSNEAGAGSAGGGAGGGLANYGTVTLTNATFARNQAGDNLGPSASGGNGGGIANAGTATLINVTIGSNHAGIGAYHGPPGMGEQIEGTVRIANSIIAGTGANCSTTLTSLGHNIDSGTACGLASSGDLSTTSPLLDVLKSNGGFTQTMALLHGSPAIDAADLTLCPERDERGVPRPQGRGCDIGAYELAVSGGTPTATPRTPTPASPSASIASSTATPTPPASATPSCAATGTPHCSGHCSPCPTIRTDCAAQPCGACVQNPSCEQNAACLPDLSVPLSGCCACATFTATTVPTSTPHATASVPVDTNCDDAVSAADVPGLLRRLSGAALDSCRAADSSQTAVETTDLPGIIEAIFNTP